MRGWSRQNLCRCSPIFICPAYAGMILSPKIGLELVKDLSRVCGDDPKEGEASLFIRAFVPRMRGWSSPPAPNCSNRLICPAYAGMILMARPEYEALYDLSRVCGDDPQTTKKWEESSTFVPRMRGWSLEQLYQQCRMLICPAYAGMILLCGIFAISCLYLSRVCGDDPCTACFLKTSVLFVPRMRGWSQQG